MFQILRKMALLGLGAVAMTSEKIRQAIDEMISRGEISAEEGKKLYEELASKAEEHGHAMNERIRSQARDMLKDLGLADRTQVAALESRLDALQQKIDELSGQPCPPPPPEA